MGKKRLPWQHKFENQMQDAELIFDGKDYESAHKAFQEAFKTIPAPREKHPETTRAIMAIADTLYMRGQYEAAWEPLADLMVLPGGAANPYIRLRRGQVLCHLGKLKEARVELTTAFLNGGPELFADETDCKDELLLIEKELGHLFRQ